jgi:hypothetical protein
MKKIILTLVMAWALLYIGLIDFSYAEDLAKDFSELTGTEITKENTPMILAQEKSTTGNYDFQEPYDTKKVEEEEEDEEKEEKIEEDEDEDDDDDHGARGKQKQKEIQQEQKRLKREGNNDPQAK